MTKKSCALASVFALHFSIVFLFPIFFRLDGSIKVVQLVVNSSGLSRTVREFSGFLLELESQPNNHE